MQNLRLFVSEGNMIKGYVGVRKDSSLGRPHKLRLIQKIPYLFYGGIHHGQAVGVLQCLNQWFYESKGENDAGNQRTRFDPSVYKEPAPQGQHAHKRCRQDGKPHHIVAVGLLEPCRFGGLVLRHGVGVFFI